MTKGNRQLSECNNKQCEQNSQTTMSSRLCFKNVRQTVFVGLYKGKTKQTTSGKNLVSLVGRSEENSRGLKIALQV